MSDKYAAQDLVSDTCSEVCEARPELALQPYYQMKAAAIRLAERVIDLEKKVTE